MKRKIGNQDIIRYALTVALIFLVYLETGIATAFFAFCVFVDTEGLMFAERVNREILRHHTDSMVRSI